MRALSPPVRLAYVTETYPPELNGVSLTVERCERYLRQRCHEVDLIRPRQANELRRNDGDMLLAAGVPIPVYPDLRFGLPATARLVRRWRRRRPHLVHVATEGPLGWSAIRAARRLNIPATSDFRTNFHQYSRYYGMGWMEGIVLAYLRSFHNSTRRTFVPTAMMRDQLLAAGFRDIEVIGRGVDTRLFDPAKRSMALRAEWGAAPDSPVLLYVGRLAAEKNVGLAFEAMATARCRVDGATCVVVGDGPLGGQLRERYRDCVFLGVRKGESLAAVYASADIFLFPSLTDTFGNVVLEAMASGLLPLAFDRGAAHEHLYAAPDTGLSAPECDAAFVAAAVDMARHPEGYAHLRRSVRQRALLAGWDEVLGIFARHLEDLGMRTENELHEPSGAAA